MTKNRRNKKESRTLAARTGLSYIEARRLRVPDNAVLAPISGVAALDAFMKNGCMPGSLVTVASQAGMGKSTFALNFIYGSLKRGINVGFVNMERSFNEISESFKRLNEGSYTDMFESLRVETPHSMRIEELVEFISKSQAELIVIDYLELLTVPQGKNPQTYYDEVVHTLHKVAVNSNITIMVLTQLSRNGVSGIAYGGLMEASNIVVETSLNELELTVDFLKHRFAVLEDSSTIYELDEVSRGIKLI